MEKRKLIKCWHQNKATGSNTGGILTGATQVVFLLHFFWNPTNEYITNPIIMHRAVLQHSAEWASPCMASSIEQLCCCLQNN